eukprot:5417974-Alexandrium_andersonii.AAC.1
MCWSGAPPVLALASIMRMTAFPEALQATSLVWNSCHHCKTSPMGVALPTQGAWATTAMKRAQG